ncbi:hypothetical protein [Flavobacterium orientale]|uniref:Uncharacterized protein n=1 Tax=Flavobacterium orientale TaxID=1756020 RepID=A0A916Y2Y7_9FLAO|nr:hypothetical protein [Flavobacterium orientale]GGD28907.1 hypothetical protein GCM10011343_18840 [Flavobacterium orientale]
MTKKTYATVTGKFSTQVAITSFLIGTLVFILSQLFPKVDSIFIIGIFYVMIALFVNGVVFLNLVHHFLFFRNHREYFGIKILIVMANIPIAVGYFYITINRINLFTF